MIAQGLLLGCLSFSAGAEGDRQMLTQDRVVQALRQYVLEHSAWRPDQVEVDLHAFTPLSTPDGEVEIVFLKQDRGPTPGRHHFLLGARVNGREETRVWIDADVKVFEKVVVTSQPLAHYEAISREKVRLERRDLGETPGQPLTSIGELEGKLAAAPIEINQALTASMVALPQVIRRGATVALVYESAGIRVETSGRAVEPGRVGDHIHVENPDSGKVLEGQILDERTVKVN
jgi:flagella basal body P-ring formation protein FlgA